MVNEHALDRFTLAHLGVGYVLGLVLTVPAVLVVALAWELAERPAKRKAPELFPNPSQDSVPNMAGDIAAMGLGAYLARGMK